MAKVTMTPVLGAAGGSMANLTFVRQADGTTSMRERKGGKNPRSAAQTAQRAAMARVSAAWQTLSDAERAAWETYAEELHDLSATPSLGRARSGYRVFSQLGLKALQATPGMAVPALPPSAPFYGDGAKVMVEPFPLGRGRGGVEGSSGESRCAEGGRAPTLPSTWGMTQDDFGRSVLSSSPSADPPKGEETAIRFTCLVPNSPGVATELLLQPLASPGRKGEADKYRSKGFVTFGAAGETVEVPCPPGTCLVAVRFVELATGAASGLVPLGRLRVG